MTERIIAYCLLAAFFFMDFIIRKGKTAKAVRQTRADKSSTRFIITTFTVILLSSYVLNYFSIGSFNNRAVAISAIVVMLLGFMIRIWSVRALSSLYTRSLLTVERQQLVQTGIYGKIRHPGYLGTLLIWGAAGLAMQNRIIFMLSLLLAFLAYAYRIRTEEHMMLTAFGRDYEAYKKQSWRLIPYLW